MDKFFHGGKWFVGFCALFIIVWVALQTVSNMRLENEAQMIGDGIFSWFWPGPNCESQAKFSEATIIKKTENDAVVQIKGKQILTTYKDADKLDISSARQETVDCSLTLTLYRSNNKWVLGRVEL